MRDAISTVKRACIIPIPKVPTTAPKRKDWSGKGWADYLIDATAIRDGETMADVLTSDVWQEQV